MREAGDVCFADVQHDGEGVVEFLRREDMEYALRCLDRTEFRSHQVSGRCSTPPILNSNFYIQTKESTMRPWSFVFIVVSPV
jgi:hypothetical protein